MKELLFQLMENSKSLTIEQLLLNIVVALIVGFVIYLSYWLSHVGTVYSKKFNVSLIMLTILTAMVMAVIGNNVALSLGMVGALSIVRYRTAIKDSRDTAYIFWAIIAGICCGASEYLIVSVGSAAVFLVLLLFGRVKNDQRFMLILRGNLAHEKEIEALIFKKFNKRARLRVKNTTKETLELIYEIRRKDYESANKGVVSIVSQLYNLGDIYHVNIVEQSDEIV